MHTISEINSMDYEVFLETLGNVIEHSSLLIAAIWTKQPFASPEDFLQKLFDLIDSLSVDGKIFVLFSS